MASALNGHLDFQSGEPGLVKRLSKRVSRWVRWFSWAAGLSLGLSVGSGLAQRATGVIEADFMQKGLKFSDEALAVEDEEIVIGVFGSNANEKVTHLEALADGRFLGLGWTDDQGAWFGRFTAGAISGLQSDGKCFLIQWDHRFRMVERFLFLPASFAEPAVLKAGEEAVFLAGHSTGGASVILKISGDLNTLVWSQTLPNFSVVDAVELADRSLLVVGQRGDLVRIAASGEALLPFDGHGGARRLDLKKVLGSGTPVPGMETAEAWRNLQIHAMVPVDGSQVVLAGVRGDGREIVLVRLAQTGEVMRVRCLAPDRNASRSGPLLAATPGSGTVWLACTQQGPVGGSAPTPGNVWLPHERMQGNAPHGWLGQLRADDLEIITATGLRPALTGTGAGSELQPKALRIGPGGRPFVAGQCGPGLEQVGWSFQGSGPEGSAFLMVFSQNLERVLHAHGLYAEGAKNEFLALGLGRAGPAMALSFEPADGIMWIDVANPERTNFLRARAFDHLDVLFGFYPAHFWFVD